MFALYYYLTIARICKVKTSSPFACLTLKTYPFFILFWMVSYSAIIPHMMAYLWGDTAIRGSGHPTLKQAT